MWVRLSLKQLEKWPVIVLSVGACWFEEADALGADTKLISSHHLAKVAPYTPLSGQCGLKQCAWCVLFQFYNCIVEKISILKSTILLIIITKVKGLRKWRNKPLKVSQIGPMMATSIATATRIRSFLTVWSNFLQQRPALATRLSPQESIRAIKRLTPLLIEVLMPLQPVAVQAPLDWCSSHRVTPPRILARHKFSAKSSLTRLCGLKISATWMTSWPTRRRPKVLQTHDHLRVLQSWSKRTESQTAQIWAPQTLRHKIHTQRISWAMIWC